MSQSPLQRTGDAKEYELGWKALYDMARRGRSFSGRERNCAFLNLGDGSFADVSAISGFNFPDDGRAIAVTDWDHDGRLDLWVASRSGPRLRFLSNRAVEGSRWLSFRLRGMSSNRDGIGARVILEFAGGERLSRTLHAGDGYLSQGSKWMHFGLGERRAEAVQVRWPGGELERFSLPEAGAENARLVLEEGAGTAWLEDAKKRAVVLVPTTLTAPPATDLARIVLAVPLEIPQLRTTGPDGEHAQIASMAGAPLLINLWASWCVNCQVEMKDLIEHRDEIEASGLRILALSLDKNEDRDAAAAAIERLDWPFEWGYTPPRSANMLTVLLRTVLSSDPDMVLPTSFLLDANGRVTTIYRGPVKVDQLLEDVGRKPTKQGDPRDVAVPFEGRWMWGELAPNWIAFADRLAEHGHPIAAANYLLRLMRSDEAAIHDVREELCEVQVRIADALQAAGEVPRALPLYQHACLADPWSALPRLRLARYWEEQGDVVKALVQYRKASVAEPENADVHFRVGLMFANEKRFEAAVEAFTAAIALDPEHGLAHLNLALGTERLGRFEEGIPFLRVAFKLMPERMDVGLMLGEWFTRAGDSEGALRVFTKLRKDHPGEPTVLHRLGLALAKAGRIDEAERVLGALRRTGSSLTSDLQARLRTRRY